MTSTASESPLSLTARTYFESKGMEIAPVAAPFNFLIRNPKEPSCSTGVVLVEDGNRLNPDAVESFAAAATSQTGITRVALVTDSWFPPGIISLDLPSNLSLIDRAELAIHSPMAVTTPPAPSSVHHSGDHVPSPASSSGKTPPPLPALTAVNPVVRKPKRSLSGQIAILIAALYIGGTSMSSILEKVYEGKRGFLQSLLPRADTKPYVLPVTEQSPTYKNSREKESVAYFREMYRLDEVKEPSLIALAEDLEAEHHSRIPKFYLDPHWPAIEKHWSQLVEHEGLLLLLTSYFQVQEERSNLYETLIPELEDIGDTRLVFEAKVGKAFETKRPADVREALDGLDDMLKAAEAGSPFRIEEHLGNFLLNGGDYLFTNEPQAALQIIESSSAVPPWFKHLMRGEHHSNTGWNARGTGYANTVSDADWRIFKRELALAEASYKKSWESHPHPYVGSQLIAVAKSLHGHPETLRWFEETIAIRADYSPAYRNYLSSLMPRWGGSNAETRYFGKACLHPALADTRVPIYLLTAHNNRARESDDRVMYWRSLPMGEQQEILQMIDAKIASNPHPAAQRYYHSLKAGVLCMLGRYHQTGVLFGQLSNELDDDAFKFIGLSSDELINTLVFNRISVTFAKEPGA